MVRLQTAKSTDHVSGKFIEHTLKLVDDKLVVVHGGSIFTQEAAQIVQQQVEMSTEGIAAEVMEYVQQLVEGKLAVTFCGNSTNHETREIVKYQVDMAMEGVASAIKGSVELDLKKARESTRDELLRCAEDVYGPLYELVRDFVAETTTNANRQLEERIQKMLTHTQAEINLQVHRQADATTAIHEHVKTNCARMDRRSQQSIAGLISAIASLAKKKVSKCNKALQIKAPQINHDASR
ncbi:unnamed protein product [Hyaloperonospora brassicae]|uniref:Band 7 domain-containing protein n=1 Tax=Hyaloperonospora brassicae TaxID=162125 RepID=A0AAV0T1Q7_HYABA|nr:unnamed protein product [Hyaloperonospora brassicae]